MSFSGDLYPTAGANVVMTTTGDLVRYNAGARQRLGIGSTNQALSVVGGLPAWKTLTLADSVLTTAGDVLYENNTPELARLPKGSDADVLTLASGLPTWSAPAGGGGKLELLTSSVLTGTASDMTSSFTSVNGADLASIVVMWDTKNSTAVDFFMQFSTAGAFITNNYYSNLMDTVGNVIYYSNQADWQILDNPDSRRQAGTAEIYIADSTQTASTADPLIFSNGCDTNAEGQILGGTNNASYYSIDGVKIYPASGSLQVGSRLAVYKKANS